MPSYPIIRPLSKRQKNNTECREGEEDEELLMGMTINAVILENTKGVPQKLQIERPHRLATPLLGMLPKEMTQQIKETPARAFLVQSLPPTRSQDVINLGIHQ